jgi:hypothetical protein
MMRVLCPSVIVVGVMGVGVRIVHVVDMTGRRHRRRFGFRSDLAQGMQEAAPFYPEEPRADQHDECVTDELDDAHRLAHHLRGGADQHRGDGDNGHGGRGLQQSRGEREHDATPPGFLVGEQVGANHRLAVAGTGGVENAVDERNSHQSPIGRAAGVGESGARASFV